MKKTRSQNNFMERQKKGKVRGDLEKKWPFITNGYMAFKTGSMRKSPKL